MGGVGSTYNDANRYGAFGPANAALGQSETGQTILDPLDLFGVRAGETQDEMDAIAYGSAQDAIAAQEEMRQIIAQYLEPYRQGGLDALGDFQSMATTGQVGNALSPEYQFQRDQGMQNINRQLSAAGRRNSTYGGRVASDFLGQLGQEEGYRQWGRSLDAIKMGMGAMNSLGGAAANAGQMANSLYGGLGQNLNASAQNYGQNRANTLYQAGNALSGLGAYAQYANWGQQQGPSQDYYTGYQDWNM